MSKLPENCPVCGERMEKGTLTAYSPHGLIGVVWTTPSTKRGESLNKGFSKADFRGARCEKKTVRWSCSVIAKK